MVNPIPNFAKKVWSKWNIRGVILASLFLQIILIFLAPLRKRTRKLVMLLWATYLLADYTANFCVGLISNKYGDEDTPISNINDFLLAFWTPFLLLHLGGPDTITAFSLEDNELWLRHMLGLIVQVCLTGYVFLLTLPANTLWLPTALVFLAGIIKFAERTRSLQLASVSNFRQFMIRKPDPGPNYVKLMEEFKSRQEAGLPTKIEKMPAISDQTTGINEKSAEEIHLTVEPTPTNQTKKEVTNPKGKELSNVEVVRDAYRYFVTFKGLVVDMIFSFRERYYSRDYFLKLTALDALRVIEVELNFFFEAFYTKASVLFNWFGFLCRLGSVCSVVAALVLYVYDEKHGCDEFDVKVTYTLLYGALGLDVVSLLMLLFSDHSFASAKFLDSEKNDFFGPIRAFRDLFVDRFLSFKGPSWKSKASKSPTWLQNAPKMVLGRSLLRRRWSESISGFNLISYCLRKRENWLLGHVIDYIGAKELVEQWKYVEKQPLLQELWIFIYKEVERKSADASDAETIQRICSCRGEWVIQEGELSRDDMDKMMPYVERNNVTFDQCLILWHIATDLLFYDDVHEKDGSGNVNEKYFSKLLSDYMLYLLIMQPTMMSAVRGIGQIRFQDTCADANKFFSKRQMSMEDEGKDKQFSKDGKKKNEEEGACRKLIDFCIEYQYFDVMGDSSKSVLFEAGWLANKLKQLKEVNKWKVIAQVWVELLSYAACNCIPITHVQQLSKGGEFISLVWLLMTHLGLAKQFQIKESGLKLIVGEITDQN